MRDRVKVGCSGKIISGYDVCRAFALGADYVMIARGFMFSVGCIQARACHTNRCPTGVTTQSRWRQRALVVDEKAARVANFHRNTLHAVAEVVGAAGLEHPRELKPHHLHLNGPSGRVQRGDEAYDWLADGALVNGTAADGFMSREWARAQAAVFEPADEAVAIPDPALAPPMAGAEV